MSGDVAGDHIHRNKFLSVISEAGYGETQGCSRAVSHSMQSDGKNLGPSSPEARKRGTIASLGAPRRRPAAFSGVTNKGDPRFP